MDQSHVGESVEDELYRHTHEEQPHESHHDANAGMAEVPPHAITPASTAYEATAVTAMDANTGITCHQWPVSPINTMTVEIEPGPASMGIPRGITLTSSFSAASCGSPATSLVADLRACSMSIPDEQQNDPAGDLERRQGDAEDLENQTAGERK